MELLKDGHKEEKDGIRLDPTQSFWEVLKPFEWPSFFGPIPPFLRALVDILPDGAILYLEGGSPKGKLKLFLEEKEIIEQTHTAYRKFWPRPAVFHIQAMPESLLELAAIIENSTNPIRIKHLRVYKDQQILMEGDDYGCKPIFISKQVSEERIKYLCNKLSVLYIDVSWGISYHEEFSPLFRALVDLLPDEAILYLDEVVGNLGWPLNGKFKSFLKKKSINERKQVVGKTNWHFRIPATSENLLELAELTENFAVSDEAFNFHVYKDCQILIQQCYDGPMFLSRQFLEEKVKSFCQKLSVSYWTLMNSSNYWSSKT